MIATGYLRTRLWSTVHDRVRNRIYAFRFEGVPSLHFRIDRQLHDRVTSRIFMRVYGEGDR